MSKCRHTHNFELQSMERGFWHIVQPSFGRSSDHFFVCQVGHIHCIGQRGHGAKRGIWLGGARSHVVIASRDASWVQMVHGLCRLRLKTPQHMSNYYFLEPFCFGFLLSPNILKTEFLLNESWERAKTAPRSGFKKGKVFFIYVKEHNCEKFVKFTVPKIHEAIHTYKTQKPLFPN